MSKASCYKCSNVAVEWCFFCSKPLCEEHVQYVPIKDRNRCVCLACFAAYFRGKEKEKKNDL